MLWCMVCLTLLLLSFGNTQIFSVVATFLVLHECFPVNVGIVEY